MGFPGSSAGEESTCNARDDSWVGKTPWRRDRLPTPVFLGFPGGSDGKESALCRPGFDPWVEKIPWRRVWQPTPVFLPGEFHGQRSLAGYSPGGCKELDTTEQLSPAHSKDISNLQNVRLNLDAYTFFINKICINVTLMLHFVTLIDTDV